MDTTAFEMDDFDNPLLDKLFEEVTKEEGMLSGGKKIGKGSRVIRKLKETEILFGNPKDLFIQLTPELFESINIKINEIYILQMSSSHNFYFVSIPISLKPARGTIFRRLECIVDFGPKGENEPIVQAVFPNNEWKDVLIWGGGGEMSLTLDGNMKLGMGINTTELPFNQKERLRAELTTHLNNANQMKAFITIPDYQYSMGRADIVAVGEGNSFAFWRIDKPDLRKQPNLRLGIVFKVPKATNVITITGKAAVEPDLPWLVSQLRDVFAALSQGLKELLWGNGDKKINVSAHEKWIFTLPK